MYLFIHVLDMYACDVYKYGDVYVRACVCEVCWVKKAFCEIPNKYELFAEGPVLAFYNICQVLCNILNNSP